MPLSCISTRWLISEHQVTVSEDATADTVLGRSCDDSREKSLWKVVNMDWSMVVMHNEWSWSKMMSGNWKKVAGCWNDTVQCLLFHLKKKKTPPPKPQKNPPNKNPTTTTDNLVWVLTQLSNFLHFFIWDLSAKCGTVLGKGRISLLRNQWYRILSSVTTITMLKQLNA